MSFPNAIAFVAVSSFAASYLYWKRKYVESSPPNQSDLPPTLLRRTTLLVSDIDSSLKIYQDILGLQIVFDKILPIGGKGLPTGVFDAKGRLVFLKSFHDHQVGVLGLLSYIDKPIPIRPDGPRKLMQVGDSVMLMNTTGVKARIEKLKQVPGVNIVSEGSIDKYPGVKGNTITVWGNSFFDPDGNFIELNEVFEGEV